MNTQQRKYALERVDAILAGKVKLAKEASANPKKVISSRERYALLASGKIKLRKDVEEITNYTDVTDAYDFSKYEDSGQPVVEKYEPIVNALNAKAAQVRDEIMLGDAEAALKLIAEFANS